jgi:hypothetical protein
MYQLFDFSIAVGWVRGPVVLFGLSAEEIARAAQELRRAAPMADFVPFTTASIKIRNTVPFCEITPTRHLC